MCELGDGPIDKDVREFMNNLAALLDKTLNGDAEGSERENGFIVMIFPFAELKENEHPRCNCISNAQRQDVIAMLNA